MNTLTEVAVITLSLGWVAYVVWTFRTSGYKLGFVDGEISGRKKSRISCHRMGIVTDQLYRDRFLYGIFEGDDCLTSVHSHFFTPEEAWQDFVASKKR